MIGYIRPKKLREKERIRNSYGSCDYVFEYLDEQTGEYRDTVNHLAVSEEDAQVGIFEAQWDEIIAQDMKELDRTRDELIREKAVIRARLDRIIEELDARPDPDEFPEDFGRLSAEQFYELQERDNELGLKIEELDEKEKRAKNLIKENKKRRGSDSERQETRNRRISFLPSRVMSEIKDGEECFYIDFTEETDGIVGRIEAKTADELQKKVSLENDRFRIAQGVIPEEGNYWDSLIAQRKIAALSAAETRYLIELFNIAVFSKAIDRKAAREKIYEMLGLGMALEKNNKEELSREGYMLRDAANGADDRWNIYTFSKYIYYHTKAKGIKMSELAGRTGCDRSSLWRNLNGTSKRQINGILSEHTGRSLPEINKATSIDNFMTAEQAVAFGICDEIRGIF